MTGTDLLDGRIRDMQAAGDALAAPVNAFKTTFFSTLTLLRNLSLDMPQGVLTVTDPKVGRQYPSFDPRMVVKAELWRTVMIKGGLLRRSRTEMHRLITLEIHATMDISGVKHATASIKPAVDFTVSHSQMAALQDVMTDRGFWPYNDTSRLIQFPRLSQSFEGFHLDSVHTDPDRLARVVSTVMGYMAHSGLSPDMARALQTMEANVRHKPRPMDDCHFIAG